MWNWKGKFFFLARSPDAPSTTTVSASDVYGIKPASVDCRRIFFAITRDGDGGADLGRDGDGGGVVLLSMMIKKNELHYRYSWKGR